MELWVHPTFVKKLKNWGRQCVIWCWVVQAKFMGSFISGLGFKISYKNFFRPPIHFLPCLSFKLFGFFLRLLRPFFEMPKLFLKVPKLFPRLLRLFGNLHVLFHKVPSLFPKLLRLFHKMHGFFGTLVVQVYLQASWAFSQVA